jgi:hypothetical protein
MALVGSAFTGEAFAQDSGELHLLGTLSEKYESGGRGSATVSSGIGDPGGVSYGTYQLASALGNADRFVRLHYPTEFEGLKGGSPSFTDTWKKAVAKDPEQFRRNEHEFIKKTHYDPQVKLIESTLKVDIDARTRAFRDVIWSCAVHHGPHSKIILTASKNIDLHSKHSDGDWIKAIYQERGRSDDAGKLVYFPRVSDKLIPGLTRRFREELADALKLLENEP